jgi:hypothetical protein
MKRDANVLFLFPLGEMLATAGALQEVQPAEMLEALKRHVRGDWGNVAAEDAQANQKAIQCGARLLSSYKTAGGVKFWIITEADRSSTCVLLPEEDIVIGALVASGRRRPDLVQAGFIFDCGDPFHWLDNPAHVLTGMSK